jgi:phosphatidate cytidylyltransferase
MKTRLLIGSLLVAALVGVFALDQFVFETAGASRVLLWLLGLGALHEALAIAGKRVETNPGLFFFGAIAVVAVVAPYIHLGTAVPGVFLALAALLAGSVRFLGMAPLRSAPAAFPEAAILGGSILYTAGLLGFLDALVVHSVATAFAVLAVSKTTDILGYLVGSRIGKHKIAPAVSPKKSWEGTLAGVLGAGGVAVLLRDSLAGPAWFAFLLGVCIGVASLIGDLVESGFKRWAGVKDSSALLPEFGGFLDMLDGVLVAAPVAYVLLHKT